MKAITSNGFYIRVGAKSARESKPPEHRHRSGPFHPDQEDSSESNGDMLQVYMKRRHVAYIKGDMLHI